MVPRLGEFAHCGNTDLAPSYLQHIGNDDSDDAVTENCSAAKKIGQKSKKGAIQWISNKVKKGAATVSSGIKKGATILNSGMAKLKSKVQCNPRTLYT